MAEQERPLVRRKSSFGRAFDRVRDALKRRRSRGVDGVLLQSTREDETTATAQPAETPRGSDTRDEPAVTEPKVAVRGESIADSQLVPDDADEDDFGGREEGFDPAFGYRMGVNEDKARALFERHGLKYQPRSPAQAADAASASKIRRVEKPVRIRIHWTCHECQRQFGHDRVCMHCGHRRCGQCPRAPPRKVKAALEEAKVTGERSSANTGQILAALESDAAVVPPRADTVAVPELDVDDEEDTQAANQYSIARRPSSGIKLVLRSKGEAQFQPTMVATVQRIYRKPRQRVRWKCENCQTIFVDGRQCRECEHQRCETCIRTPAKRPPVPQFDPAVVQSVTDKLAAWDLSRTRGLGDS